MAGPDYEEIASWIMGLLEDELQREVCGGETTEILKSENPWNAWCHDKTSGQEWFVTGGYWRYLELKKRTIEELIKRLQKELEETLRELKEVKEAYYEKAG